MLINKVYCIWVSRICQQGTVRQPLWGEAGIALSWPQLVTATSKGPTTGHGWAQQPRQWCLGEMYLRKGKNTEWGTRGEDERTEWERGNRKVRREGHAPWWTRHIPKRDCRTLAEEKEKLEEGAAERNCCALTLTHQPPIASKKAQTLLCAMSVWI